MPQKAPPHAYKPGQSGNPAGRPKLGRSIAERARTVTGADGGKLVSFWAAMVFKQFPTADGTDTNTAFIANLHTLTDEADLKDRILCSRILADRAFGLPLQQVDVGGEMTIPVRVVHEYQKSS